MNSEFYRKRFSDFAEGIEKLDDKSKACPLSCCAKKCADTDIIQKYKDVFLKTGGDRDRFYTELEIPGSTHTEVLVPGKEYLIEFPECGFDLHTTGGVE